MQDSQNQSENWQQPDTSSTAAPYEVPRDEEALSEAQQPVQQLIETSVQSLDGADDDQVLLRWEGTEYIHKDRSMLWFAGAGVVTLVFFLIAFFLLKSITFSILIPVMAVALFVYARRPPEALHYILSRKGLHIEDKLLTYDQFKSFGVVGHEGTHSVVLTPRKRFQIAQIIYFPEEIGEQLVDFLAARLPMKEVAPDSVDRLLSRLHL